MAQSNKVLVASAGVLSMSPGNPISFTVFWPNNIGSARWTRIWPTIQEASDEANHQHLEILSEGSQWDTDSPHPIVIAVTLRGESDSGAPVAARIEVMTCQDDTF